MSPTTRVGQSDPTRGTAPEAITPGRYAGTVAVVTGAARASAGPRRAAWPPRGEPWPASIWPRTPS